MATDSSRRRGTPLSVASLFGSLTYGAVLSAYTLDILGTTAATTEAVTAAFLLSAAVGGLVHRVSWARAEAALVLYCAGFPLLLPWLGEFYLAIAPSITDASALSRNGARFAFAMLVFAVPGFSIGVTIRTLASVSAMTAGAALGWLAATDVLIPRFGLVATLGIATFVKLTLPLMSRPAKTPEATNDTEPAPLPWKPILIAAAAAGGILAVVFFRTLLALALQYPALAPGIAGVALVAAVLRRREVELPRSTSRWLAAFLCGALVFVLATAHGAIVLVAVAIGALAGRFSSAPKRWVLPSAAVAAVLVALSVRAGSLVDVAAAVAVGIASSLVVRALGSVGAVFTAGAAGALAALALSASLPATAPSAARSGNQDAVIAALFTSERTRALASDVTAVDTLGFDDVVCPSEHAPGCLPEDLRSVLFESPSRYDVIADNGPPTRELFQLASKRLRRHGVLVYRLPVGRLPPSDAFVAINTARSVIPHVSLWQDDGRAYIVASNEPLRIDLDSVRAFVSGSPLDFLRQLVVADDDMDRFLDAMASLVDESRDTVATDDRPISITRARRELDALQNHAIFDHLRSDHALGFRGEPTSEEEATARAAFEATSLSRLARAWRQSSNASLAASRWLYQEMSGRDASELRKSLDDVATLISATDTLVSCRPLPRFVSRIDRVPLFVRAHSGDSLDGTEPEDAVDGAYDPFTAKGWKVRRVRDPIALELALTSPIPIATVHLVVRPIEVSRVKVRLFGRDRSGTWYPLASDAASECDGVRRFQLSRSTPELDALRVELDGSALAVHELWAEAW